jgi:hypothetical protein
LPAAVASVIDRALELEMADRWPSAREMQSALRAARGGARKAGFVSNDSSKTLAASPPSRAGEPLSVDGPEMTTRRWTPDGNPKTETMGRSEMRPIQTPSGGVTVLATPKALAAATATATETERVEVRVDGPTMAAPWVPGAIRPSPPALNAEPEAPFGPEGFTSNPLPRPGTRPMGPVGYPPYTNPQGSVYPGAPPGPAQPPRLSEAASLRVIALVAIGFVVVCAAMAAWVMFHGAPRVP